MDTCDTLWTRNARYTVIVGIANTLASAIPYGAQLVLQWICVIILRRRPASTTPRARNLLLGATLLMTTLSTIYVTFSVTRPILELLGAPSWQELGYLWTDVGQDAALFLNILIGDAVVFWRAWVLWKHPCKAVYIPGILLICSAAGALAFVLFTIVVGRKLEAYFILAFLALGLSVVTNLATNVSVGYYTWLHRKAVREFLENGNQYARYENALMLVLESGIVYTILLLFCVIMDCIAISIFSHHPTNPTWAMVHAVVRPLGMGMISIYPSLLIVVVFLRKSAWDSAGNMLYTHSPEV